MVVRASGGTIPSVTACLVSHFCTILHGIAVSQEDADSRTCSMCERVCAVSAPHRENRVVIDDDPSARYWHCADCSSQPMGLYTTWIALSNSRPSESVLCLSPQSHQLRNWHEPLPAQVQICVHTSFAINLPDRRSRRILKTAAGLFPDLSQWAT